MWHRWSDIWDRQRETALPERSRREPQSTLTKREFPTLLITPQNHYQSKLFLIVWYVDNQVLNCAFEIATKLIKNVRARIVPTMV